MLNIHKMCVTIFNGYRLKVEEVWANFENKVKEQKKQMRGKLLTNSLEQKLNYTKIAAM
jgi:hypothetical protein